MIYLADKKYNGTIERRIALVLDHHMIFSGNGTFALRDSEKGMAGLVDAIKEGLKERTAEELQAREEMIQKLIDAARKS